MMTLKDIADKEKTQHVDLDIRYLIISGLVIVLVFGLALWLSQLHFIMIDLFNVFIDLIARMVARVIGLFV